MALRYTISPETLEAQRRASDPATTAWVSANAGSGKTHVLTQRVIRLLLQGVPPAKILCLTFTKAAAANMSMRVFNELSRWTTAPEDDLTHRILDTGHPLEELDLAFARRLFARTVETPGGLKIQTIHAFCERLLHLFPFEADVGSQFRVVEEDEQAEFLAQARLRALNAAAATPDSALGRALVVLATQTSATGFEELIREALNHRDKLPPAATDEELLQRVRSGLQTQFGLAPHEDAEEIERSIVEDGISSSRWRELAVLLATGSANDGKLAKTLTAAADLSGPAQVETYLEVFFTGKDEPRGGEGRNIVTKGLQKAAPTLLPMLQDEQDRLIVLKDKHRAGRTVERSAALALLLRRIARSYAQIKDAHGVLDFDDLIQRTKTLLTRSGASWVLFKLDAGIDHILVDEAQDTSEPQWSILRALADEFAAGQGRAGRPRTFFAVGDEKQSIYSFQGANPRLFDETRRHFERRMGEVEQAFASVELKTSFRSAAGVLTAVDQVFGFPAYRRGLSSDDNVATVHLALKRHVPSLIEIWDPVQPANVDADRDWRLPLDMSDPDDPPVKVARRIARMVRGWLAVGSTERVEDDATGRPRQIRAGDVLILVRRRGAFFEAVIRALKEEGVPVAGADRLELTKHIAAMDLIAAGRVALLPQDDLTLASVLKSPLVGLDDDDLLALAPHREGSLFEALTTSDDPRHRDAAATLTRWQRDASVLTPFRFYARLLGADGVRRRLLARLGPEAGDAVDEFLKRALQQDRSMAPSLHSFLTLFEATDLNIKRDMEAAGEAVRVMTVHAAKGLEAKIVLLPDTCGAPGGRFDPKLFILDPPQTGPLIAWSPRGRDDCAALATARQTSRDAADDEYRRLLYVALTRAQERLYIMGYHGVTARPETCWFEMVARALGEGMVQVPAPWSSEETVRRLTTGAFTEPGLEGATAEQTERRSLPGWLETEAPGETAARALRPSRLDLGSAATADAAARKAARERGTLVHALLQNLAGIDPSLRRTASQRLMAGRKAAADPREADAIFAEVEAVLDDPRLAPLFAAGSRAEVAIAGAAGEHDFEISGQVDRIAVRPDEVLIADFKTGAAPAGRPPRAYVTQLALYGRALANLYPGRRIRALLVYTSGPSVSELSPEQQAEALAELARRRAT